MDSFSPMDRHLRSCRRRLGAVSAGVLFALALPAGAAAGFDGVADGPVPVELPVELVAPRDGAVLRAGETLTVEWAPRAGFERLEAEEWEAFLSFDGGRYYAVRVTPHLDIVHRRFTFEVPGVVTDDARLMLRFGDEVREEVGFEMPQRFAVAPRLVTRGPEPTAETHAPGEAARPRDRGVVVWVEGSRSGTGLRRHTTADPTALLPGFTPSLAFPFILSPTHDRDGDGTLPAPAPLPHHTLPKAVIGTPRGLPVPWPIRQLACRQNE